MEIWNISENDTHLTTASLYRQTTLSLPVMSFSYCRLEEVAAESEICKETPALSRMTKTRQADEENRA